MGNLSFDYDDVEQLIKDYKRAEADMKRYKALYLKKIDDNEQLKLKLININKYNQDLIDIIVDMRCDVNRALALHSG